MNKIIVLLVLYLCSLPLLSQNPFSSNKNNNRTISIRSVPISSPDLRPNPLSVVYKFSIPAQSDSSIIAIEIKKYKVGNEIIDDRESVVSRILSEKEKLGFEIIPEFKPNGQLTLFFNFIGFTSYKYRGTNKDNIFKWIDFPIQPEKGTYGKSLPLMLIYEEEKNDASKEQKIKSILIDDKLPLLSLKKLEKIVDEYYLIVYTITKK